MDYHLDWLQMALYLAATPSPPSPIPNDDLFKANQEDVDLLVAFDDTATTHLVLVEAKMETGWRNSQLRSKAQRLRLIFGTGRPGAASATPRFVLASPKKPGRLRTDSWPEWDGAGRRCSLDGVAAAPRTSQGDALHGGRTCLGVRRLPAYRPLAGR